MTLFTGAPADEDQIEPELEPVRLGREAMARPVADFADPGQAWSIDDAGRYGMSGPSRVA